MRQEACSAKAWTSSWVEGPTRYTVVHSPAVAILFIDTDPVDAITFHRDLLGSEDPKTFFNTVTTARPGR
ncbi:hypothetical protein [Arthrobacter sp. CC3]|uniref:hypothetical protein n=1 Tax=Arthrobacter sp. CC3 TaxID=3029185 RepID=UPI003265B016